jgi:hypothetical protein
MIDERSKDIVSPALLSQTYIVTGGDPNFGSS